MKGKLEQLIVAGKHISISGLKIAKLENITYIIPKSFSFNPGIKWIEFTDQANDFYHARMNFLKDAYFLTKGVHIPHFQMLSYNHEICVSTWYSFTTSCSQIFTMKPWLMQFILQGAINIPQFSGFISELPLQDWQASLNADPNFSINQALMEIPRDLTRPFLQFVNSACMEADITTNNNNQSFQPLKNSFFSREKKIIIDDILWDETSLYNMLYNLRTSNALDNSPNMLLNPEGTVSIEYILGRTNPTITLTVLNSDGTMSIEHIINTRNSRVDHYTLYDYWTGLAGLT